MLFFKIVLFFTLLSSMYGNSKLLVIVSKDSSLQTIEKKELSKIFLSKTKEYQNGERVVAIEPSSKELQSLFYKEVSGRSKKQLKRYWATMVFTGRGVPPKKMESTASIIEFVKNNKSAIAYVSKESILDDTVRIVLEL